MIDERHAARPTGTRAARRLVVASLPVLPEVGGYATGGAWSLLACLAAAVLTPAGVLLAFRSWPASITPVSRWAMPVTTAVITITTLGLRQGDGGAPFTGAVLLLALPQIVCITLFWAGPGDLVKRIFFGLLGIPAGVLLGALVFFVTAGLSHAVAPGVNEDSWHGLAGLLWGFAGYEAGLAVVVFCCVAPTGSQRRRRQRLRERLIAIDDTVTTAVRGAFRA